MRILALLLLAACQADSEDPIDTGDADTDADTDSDADSDADADADPAGLVGDWLVQPCLVGERIAGDCSAWWSAQEAIDWVGVDLSCLTGSQIGTSQERIHIRGDGTAAAEWDLWWVTCEGDSAGPQTVTREIGPWAHVEGDTYTMAGVEWTVVQLGKGISVVADSDSMMLSAL